MADRSNKKVIVWILLALCVIAVPVGLFANSASGKGNSDSDDEGFSLGTSDHIQVVRLSGMIADSKEEGFFPSFSSDDCPGAIKTFRKAVKNKHIKGILLRVNSPGGTVSASQELTDEVRAFRKTGRPVVVSMGDLAASGGYYVSSVCDKIVAEPGTLTGSIGVIMNMMNFKELGQKIGIRPEVIKSGEFKDIANPLRDMTPAERNLLHDLIMDSYDQFVHSVADGRKMKLEDVKKLADGRVYSGRQAKQNGLVDELGGYDKAVEELQKLCMDQFHLTDKLPVKEHENGILNSLFEAALFSGPLKAEREANINLLGSFTPPSMSPRFFKVPLWIMQ